VRLPSTIKKGDVLWGYLATHGDVVGDTRVEMFSVSRVSKVKLWLEWGGHGALVIDRTLTQPADEWPMFLRTASFAWLALFDSQDAAQKYLNVKRAWGRLYDAAKRVYPGLPKSLEGCQLEIEKATAALEGLFAMASGKSREDAAELACLKINGRM